MWLLSVDRAELHHFASSNDVDGGYAILSHTWGKEEQTFQDLQALKEKCRIEGTNPRDFVSEKIRKSCFLAEKDGYMWIWNDTCCIDKTSSSELSEAINSMYRWYASSEVCYAYLGDVPSDCDLAAAGSPFRKSRWHTRGWTLQELIAPPFVLFISQTWTVLGTKTQLANVLQEISGIDSRVLTHEVHFSTQSVATRMSWASARQTTRLEDEAYCLMGLFGVNMPTIYGEGPLAFQRLQRKIMKQSSDTSIFVWGDSEELEDTISVLKHQQIHERIDSFEPYPPLARSPRDFNVFKGETIYYSPQESKPLQPYLPRQWLEQASDEPEDSERRCQGPFGALELPRFASTPHGIEARFPLIETNDATIAVLMCQTSSHYIGLFLHPSPPSRYNHDPRRKLYHAGLGFTRDRNQYMTRLVSLGKDYYNMTFLGEPVTAEWRDLCLTSDSKVNMRRSDLSAMMSPLNSIHPAPPFRFPQWIIGRLNAMGLTQVNPVKIYDPPLLATIKFENLDLAEAITFLLGTCNGWGRNASSSPATQMSPGQRASPGTVRSGQTETAHWAKAYVHHGANWHAPVASTHNCDTDHIGTWLDQTKEFRDSERTVRLSFSRCSSTPATTVVVGVELSGPIYERMAQSRGVTLPTRRQLGTSTGTRSDLRRMSMNTYYSPPSVSGSPNASQLSALSSFSALSIQSVPTAPPSPTALRTGTISRTPSGTSSRQPTFP